MASEPGLLCLDETRATSRQRSHKCETALMANLRLLIYSALIILLVWSLHPSLMSAYYGANPPPHIARMLERQSETGNQLALMFFKVFTWAN
jgi:hypothetical protein